MARLRCFHFHNTSYLEYLARTLGPLQAWETETKSRPYLIIESTFSAYTVDEQNSLVSLFTTLRVYFTQSNSGNTECRVRHSRSI